MDVAIRKGDLDKITSLLQNGYDLNIVKTNGAIWTPLQIAARCGQSDVCSLLIRHGTDTEVRGVTGKTPLHYAAMCGNTAAVKILLEHGADILATDAAGRTPLHLALMESNATIAAVLLKGGADVNTPDSNHMTPMDYLRHYGSSLKIVMKFLKYGYELDIALLNRYSAGQQDRLLYRCQHPLTALATANQRQREHIAALERATMADSFGIDRQLESNAALQKLIEEHISYRRSHRLDERLRMVKRCDYPSVRRIWTIMLIYGTRAGSSLQLLPIEMVIEIVRCLM